MSNPTPPESIRSADDAVNSEAAADGTAARPRLSKPRMILQSVGFVVGLALLAWCIQRALASGELGQLREASPTALTMLIVCTLVSVVTNGAIFWLIIFPAAPVRFRDVQYVNCVVNLVNYLPIRFGIITRMAHHRKVDRLDYFTLFAWYAAVGLVMMLVFGAVVLATILRPAADGWWVLILGAVLAAGLGVIVYVVSHQKLTKRLRGADRMLQRPGFLVAAVVLRLFDLGAYGGRLYYSLGIIGISVSFREWLYLTLLSMISSLVPFGSFGFREYALARLGPYLTKPELEGQLAAAALIDRGAEAVVFIPLGVICTLWMLKRWKVA